MKISDTFGGFKSHFLIARGNKIKTYKAVIATLMMFMTANKVEDVRDCTASLLEDYLTRQMGERAWSPKTYRNHWQNFKFYFDWAVKKGYLPSNPIVQVAKPKLPKPVPRAINREEVKTILHATEWLNWRYALERPRNVALLSIMILAGLRLQEVLNLRLEDVNLHTGEITVLQGKGNKDRVVHMPQQLILRLKEYAQHRGGKPRRLPFFASVKSDKALTVKNVQDIVRKIQIASGIYFTPHMLRHTYAKLCLEAEINLFCIKEEMGHESIKTTQRYLSISTQKMQQTMKNAQLI
ncbi:tyrosine-type recombinase/integrase [Terasakiella sp.]|uniref:tyrosine-type recombinase/integrase n=1 Tax=Terasakiella sp. TaxID=2034861 RepID=UPI003AA8001B